MRSLVMIERGRKAARVLLPFSPNNFLLIETKTGSYLTFEPVYK